MVGSLKTIISTASLFFCLVAFSQTSETNTWKGVIKNQLTGEVIPNAVIAVYSQVALYSADEQGTFRIPLLLSDSVRVVALGFQSATFCVGKVKEDLYGNVCLNLHPVSYSIKEVTIKGYKGILDPLIFPKLLDDYPKIELNLPSNIGSRMSNKKPGERLLMGKPNPIAAVFSPVSFGYSLFSKHEKSLRNLAIAQEAGIKNERLNSFASRETIALLSGFSGKELDVFIIYCNLNLKINSMDNGASVAQKIEILLAKYLEEQGKKEITEDK